MLYAIYCKDKPNHLQTRLDNRPTHVEYLKQCGAACLHQAAAER
jgi:uncharacterized protein